MNLKLGFMDVSSSKKELGTIKQVFA